MIFLFGLLFCKKYFLDFVRFLREDDGKIMKSIDQASQRLNSNHPSHADVDASNLIDWSVILKIALECVQASESTKARSSGPTIELWQGVQFLFETAERNGHFFNKSIIDACMHEILTILHLDSGPGSGSSSAAEVVKDSYKIQGSIGSLSIILGLILAYPPYAEHIKQEHFHDIFKLFSNTLITLSRLSSKDLSSSQSTLLDLIKPHSHFPDSFLGLYQAPVAAVNVIVQMVVHYPYTAWSSSATSAAAVKKFLRKHVFPFYLSIFTLRIPDNLLTRLLAGLNGMMEQHVMTHLTLFREFSHKFIHSMIQPSAWPKSATIKNEAIRFINLVFRVAKQLPINNSLTIVEGEDEQQTKGKRSQRNATISSRLLLSIIVAYFLFRVGHRPSFVSSPLP